MTPSFIPTSGRSRSGGIFITPNIYTPYHKVEITWTGDLGASTTITYIRGQNDKVLAWTVTGRINAVKQATIALDANDGFWVGKLKGGEAVKVYADYTGTLGASSLLFNGKLDEYRFNLNADTGFVLELHCRQIPQMEDETFIENYAAMLAEDIVSDILSTYYAGFVDVSLLPSTGQTISVNFNHVNGSQAISKVCESIGYKWYIQEDNKIVMFQAGTLTNSTEKVGLGTNAVSANSCGKDFKDVLNRVFVYGTTASNATNVYYLKTQEDETSQSALWIRDRVINDANVKSNDEATNLANAQLTISPPRRGVIQCAGGLLTLQAGQKISVQLPYMELQGWFIVGEFTHSWTTGGLNTYISLEELKENLARLFQERILAERGLRPNQNDNFMFNSATMDFTSDTFTDTFNNTQIVNNKLVLNTGYTTGTWTSISQSFPADVTSVELRIDGDDLGACTAQFSGDNGVTWTTVTLNTATSIASTNQVKMKVLFATSTEYPAPAINAVAIMAK